MSPVAPLPESHTASTSTNGAMAGSKPHRPLAPPPIQTSSNGSARRQQQQLNGANGDRSPRRHHASIPPVPHALDDGDSRGVRGWWRRVRRRAAQWAYAEEEEEKLPMLVNRQQSAGGGGASGAGPSSPPANGRRALNVGYGSPRRGQAIPGAEPGMYLSPRARAALLRRQEKQATQGEGGAEEVALPRSLSEVYHSIPVPRARPGETASWGRRLKTLAAYMGPGAMVACGYLDPGNWATDIAGGALFQYSLLFVVVLSSLLAIFLQVLTVKLGIATKRDLAQLCAEVYSPKASTFLWITAEIAIAACDLAEVIGSAIALQLLFGLPLVWGCWLTALDVLLVLSLFDKPNTPSGGPTSPSGNSSRFRLLEAAVAFLVLLIFACFAVEVSLSKPSLPGVLKGMFWPDLAGLVASGPKLYIAMGILGATVMPHNLYLHSSLVQTRDFGDSHDDKAEAILYSSLDTVLALGLALFVNAAILVVAAAAFYDPTGKINGGEAPSVAEAYHLLAPILGNKAASLLFGIALLASGQNSTLTGTLAGQIVMEGFVQIRLRPWLRRLGTRLMVVVPAVLTVALAGQEGVDTLLVLSQVVLSLQLPFAVIPLVAFTSDLQIMGPHFVNGPAARCFGWAVAGGIVLLNAWLVVATVWQGGSNVAT